MIFCAHQGVTSWREAAAAGPAARRTFRERRDGHAPRLLGGSLRGKFHPVKRIIRHNINVLK